MKYIFFMLFCFLSSVTFSQRTVSGQVTDADGEVLIGATVREVGNDANGVITDIEGNFVLEVDNNATGLSVSYVGYEPKVITLGTESNYNVSLSLSNELEAVFITTYGKDGQTPISGSIALVEAEEIENVPIASFEQILQGKAPGLTVLSGSGQPGTAATVRIRGAGSINGSNSPLYILDGIQLEPGEFASLNPNDFEVAAVLKDAASTSIYGSRASNGVIVLRTKRGREGKTQIRFTTQFGTSEPGRQKFEMMGSNELLAFQEIAGAGAGWSLSPNNPQVQALPIAEQEARAEELARLRGINNDWRDLFFRDGKSRTYDLSFRGGSENTKFYASFGIYDEDGIALRSALKRKSARLNLDHNINDKFRMNLQTYAGGSNSTFIESENGISLANGFAAVYLGNPFETINDSEGSILWQGNDPTGINRYAGYVASNAYARLSDDSSGRDEFKGNGVINFEYDLTDFLTVNMRSGIDYRTRIFERYQNPDSYGGGRVSRGNRGSLQESTTRLRTITAAPALNFSKEFSDKHYVSSILGYEYIDRDYISRSYTGYQLNNLYPGITPQAITYVDPDSGEPVAVVGGSNAANRLNGGFLNATYTYDDKYEIAGGIRRDASSRFGGNNKSANFWNVAGKWYLDQESFIENSKVVDILRLRLSYGTTGNQEYLPGLSDASNFRYLPTLAAGTNQTNEILSISTLPNPDLQWESKTEANIGVDFGLFNSRLNGSLDVYNKETEDLFITKLLSATTGSTSIGTFNAGSVRNRGVELEIDGDIFRKDKFTWNIGANLAYNKNEVLNLGGESEFESGTSIIRVGEELGAHYIVGWAGVDPATGDPLYHDGRGGITKDFNSAEPTTGWGSSNPPWIGGFDSSIDVGNLSVFAQFNFAANYRRFNNQTFFQENPNFAQFNLSSVMNTIWRQPGDVTEVQRIGTNREFSSKDIEDADYLRFRNLRVNYDLSNFASKVKGVENFNVFMNATNIYTWTQFTGFDPEDSNNIAGYEYPLPRQVTFGLNLGL